MSLLQKDDSIDLNVCQLCYDGFENSFKCIYNLTDVELCVLK